ncbi:ABC transporter ATP-binding protein [Ochrobactrum teleogrylli]|uniref:ABC transporter ATP-binding protein n=1 Tax=Ochrobactrum teleogrylli TaxID=2479765 RepID=A0ABY2Y2P1_9HYPH|nr:ABC transporter ATP-binding protein [[Ochrobactrum] teleogrylli]TNV14157.1 ABC transporter ATP-binding protein [[Ochrobactrum] teleogrylli]
MNALSIEHVSKSFVLDGAPRPVLKDINFEVGHNEILSIVGASGCGKSTLLRLIIGLDGDYRGSITRGDAQSTAKVGMVFQDHRLYPWLTVERNVELAYDKSDLSPASKRERVQHYLALVGLSDYAKAYPKQLSGGMAQRAAIARALAQEPDILLMDEPFAALDSILRMRLQDELLSIWEKNKVSIIIVTHDVEEALYLADRVLIMEPNPGRVRDVFDVGLPRPRDRSASILADLKKRCLAMLV